MNIDDVERVRVLLRQIRPLLDRDDVRSTILWVYLYDAVSSHLMSSNFREARNPDPNPTRPGLHGETGGATHGATGA